MKDIIKYANPKHHHYRFRILYVNTLEYLKKHYKMTVSLQDKQEISRLKQNIRETEAEIASLTKRLIQEKEELKSSCPHPIRYMIHGGYACSGTSDKFDGYAMKESVYCKLCDNRIAFEAQGVCEEYKSDD